MFVEKKPVKAPVSVNPPAAKKKNLFDNDEDDSFSPKKATKI